MLNLMFSDVGVGVPAVGFFVERPDALAADH